MRKGRRMPVKELGGNWKIVLSLMLVLGCCGSAMASASATLAVGGSEQQISGSWDSGNITIAFNGFTETVHYAQFSTPASLASALAGMFSRDYIGAGLCAHASGATITFQLSYGGSFNALEISGPTTSFNFSESGWASQNSASDSGTVNLTVNGILAAQTQYGPGSTPVTIAAGLAAGVQSGSPVTVNAQNNTIAIEATSAGSSSDYSYTLSASSSNGYSPASFMNPPATGNLDGGSNTTTRNHQDYSYVVSYQPNSNVGGFTDSVMSEWTFTYDTLNRLATATTNYQPPYFFDAGYCWSYDAFGNRQQELAAGAPFAAGSGGFSLCQPENPVPFTYTNNQVSGGPTVPAYDQAGDITIDTNGQHYLYDAEGRICAMSAGAVDGVNVMTGYVYDAEGRRVAKGAISKWSCDPKTNGFSTGSETDSILDQSGNQLTEMSGNGGSTMNWDHTNVWANGTLIATYSAITDSNGQADGALHFYLDDWLGTRRVQTDYAGVVEQGCWSLPFGDAESCQPTPTEHIFTGKERDQESGNDYFKYRYYASSMGRWLSPDPSGLMYANREDPQSLNLYSYVGNNPLTRVDLLGLCWKGFQWACDAWQDVRNFFTGNGLHTDNYLDLHPSQKQQDERQQSYFRETGQAAPRNTPKPPDGGCSMSDPMCQTWFQWYLQHRQNRYFGYGTDAAGMAGTKFKLPSLGYASAFLNFANDPSWGSAAINGIGVLPGEGAATWPTTLAVDGFDYGINHDSPDVQPWKGTPFVGDSVPGGNYAGSTSGGGASMTQFGCQMTGDCN
jgi:RHS repeat-associated protein